MSAIESANVLWFIPTHGDGRYLGTSVGGRAVDFAYLRQIAEAADTLGYYGVLLPTGKSCEDSWVVASALAPQTERLRFLVAVRPGLQSPTVAARMTATLDRVSQGRLLINVVTGGDPVENCGDGLFLAHGDRYASRANSSNLRRAVARRDRRLFRASISTSRPARSCIRRFSNRCRRSISAVRRRPASTSPRSSSTSISPGASRRPPSPKRSRSSAAARRARAEL